MLQSFAELVKSLLIPGSFPFLLFGITIGIVIAYGPRRLRRYGLPLIAAIVACYWIAGLPSVAHLVATRFHAADARQRTAADLAGARAIVVLAAGKRTVVSGGYEVAVPEAQTVLNALEGARLYKMLGLPVIASGGGGSIEEHDSTTADTESVLMRNILLRAGVPDQQILMESDSRTTREQAQHVAPMLKSRGWEPFVLVAPPVQLPRAAAVFRREGVHPMLAAAPYQPGLNNGRQSGWIPNGGALHSVERSTYDYLAWFYYWARGWL